MAGLGDYKQSKFFQKGRLLAWLPILAVVLFVLIPQLAMVVYAFFREGQPTMEGISGVFGRPQFYSALGLSVAIALTTVVVLILVLVPAVLAVHLWAPKLSGALSIICTLPLVIPSIALVAGLLQILRTMSATGRGTPLNILSTALQNSDFPIALIGTYVVLSLPFTYRSINGALSAIPVRVYYEASASLGASVWKTLAAVVLPNIKGAVVFSAFFAFSLGVGEYTVASVMSVQTLPVFMMTLSATDFRASIALSLLSNFITWTLLVAATLAAGRGRNAISQRRKNRRRSEVVQPMPTPRTAVTSPVSIPAQ